MKDNTKDIINNLTIVLVLFRSTKDILKLLDEIKNFRILIIDNGGNKEILLKIKSLNLNVDILCKNKNLCYWRAINLAYQYIKTPYFYIKRREANCVFVRRITGSLFSGLREFDIFIKNWFLFSSRLGVYPKITRTINLHNWQHLHIQYLHNII